MTVRAVKIAYSHFSTEQSDAGGQYFYSEVSSLLSSIEKPDVATISHDFHRLARSGRSERRDFVRMLGADDVLVSNVGPYAHLYHYMREADGGKFRIVRDVRTSSWAGFLLQETLSGPLTRPGDIVLFPSEFCRQYFIRRFPASLHDGNTAVSYPLASAFPQRPKGRRPESRYRIGYIGRVSDDKNFGQVLESFVEICKQEPKATLHVAGKIDDQARFGSVAAIKDYLKSRGVAADRFTYHGVLPYREIWSFLEKIDVFLFLAMASVESLGRVLMEAQHAGVRTVAAHYAAAGEILPPQNLVAPRFAEDRAFDVLGPFSFGTIDVQAVARAVFVAEVGEPRSQAPHYQAAAYTDYVLANRAPAAPLPLTGCTRDFIERLRFSGLDGFGPEMDVMPLLEKLIGGYSTYNDNALSSRLLAYAKAVMEPQGHAWQRRLRLNRLFRPSKRFEFAHAREHCWQAGYMPRLELASRRPIDGSADSPAEAFADMS